MESIGNEICQNFTERKQEDDEINPDSTTDLFENIAAPVDKSCNVITMDGTIEVINPVIPPCVPHGSEHVLQVIKFFKKIGIHRTGDIEVAMCDSTNNPIRGFPQISVCPSTTGLCPSREEFAGDLNFELLLNPLQASRKKWLYSGKLRKVFIDMDKMIDIHFKWDFQRVCHTKIYIRALPVYTHDEWVNIPVERCPVHISAEEDVNSDHVIRCESPGTIYDVNKVSKRRSCRTLVEKEEVDDDIELQYKFVCKTSCQRGMQRRPVVVIFTLEDDSATVMGRRCLSFKICSCLKRDKQREEEEHDKDSKKDNQTLNSALSENNAVPNLKRKDAATDTDACSSKAIKLDGSLELLWLNKEDYILALTRMHNTLLGETVRNKYDDTQILIQQVEDLLNKAKIK